MSVDKVVFGLLGGNANITALVGTSPKRIFPRQRPQGTDGAAPCIVYNVISDVETMSNDGPSNLATYRVQVDCYGTTSDGARALYAEVRKATKDGGPLNGFAGTVAGVVVQHCLKDDGRDDTESPQTGGSKSTPMCSVDFMIAIEV